MIANTFRHVQKYAQDCIWKIKVGLVLYYAYDRIGIGE